MSGAICAHLHRASPSTPNARPLCYPGKRDARGGFSQRGFAADQTKRFPRGNQQGGLELAWYLGHGPQGDVDLGQHQQPRKKQRCADGVEKLSVEEEEVVLKGYHPKDEGDQDAADCRHVQQVPRVVEDVPNCFANQVFPQPAGHLDTFSRRQIRFQAASK